MVDITFTFSAIVLPSMDIGRAFHLASLASSYPGSLPRSHPWRTPRESPESEVRWLFTVT